MNFFKNLQNSIYSPTFYSLILQKPFRQCLNYFLLLALFLTVIHLITLLGLFFLGTPLLLRETLKGITDCYPQNLEVRINNGQVSANVDEPYFIPACGIAASDQNLVVIDTKNPFSASQLDAYKTTVWVAKDVVFIKSKSGSSQIRSYSLTRIKDFQLNKQKIDSLYNKISPWLELVGFVLLIISGLAFYLYYIFRLIYLVFFSLIILLLSKIFKQNFSFEQSYKIGLFAITLGLIVELLIAISKQATHFNGFPFMMTLITLGVIVVNLFIPRKVQ